MNEALRLPEIRFTKTTLANGLDVIARRQGTLPIVAANLWYHVGSKDEGRGRRGFAHLFEHLMFEGSEHFPGDYFQPLQRLGASVNGSTSADRTNYFVDLPAAHVELAVAMESDRMGHFLPALSAHKLRIQKDVVKNEYRQNYANRPYGQVWSLMSEAFYPPDHPYSWMTIGAMEDVEAASLDDVEGFFRRFYAPANASLCLVGDIDEDRALALAERYFGPIPGGAKSVRPATPDTRLRANVTLKLHDRVELERGYLAWHTEPQFAHSDAALSLLGDILARGRSSRLYRKLVIEHELAQDVSAAQSGRELAGSFSMIATLRPGREWGHARDLIDAEIADIAANGVTPEELERVRNGRVAGFVYALDNVGGFGGVADRLNAYNTYVGDPSRITSDVGRFLAVTPEDIRGAVYTYFDGPYRAELVVSGRKAPASSAPPVDRSVRPTPTAAVAFRAPVPQVRTLSGGATLWVIPSRDLPIVVASAVVAAGASTHGPRLGGLASLTSSMLDEGTASRTAEQIARASEGMGTRLSSSCGWDGSYVGFQCLTPHFDASLDLATDLLLHPSFPEGDFRRVRGQVLAALRAERASADPRASRALLRALYGEDHAYGTTVDGDEAAVEALGRDDLVAFHGRHYRPGRSAWVVAGDVDPDRLADALEERLAGWSGAGETPEPVARPADGSAPRILLVDRPGAAQAVLRVGHVGVGRGDPDYDALLILNQILGGQFTSRLNTKLREEKGFTYGARSGYDARRGPGPFTASAAVQSDRAAEALDDLLGEVEAIVADRPPSPKEVDDARRSLIEGQPRHFETPPSLVARFAASALHGLPPDDHARFADRLEAVTPDMLAAASRRHLRPGALVAVVVAEADAIADDLRRLGRAEVEILPEEPPR